MTVTEVSLVRSTLGKGPAQYQAVETFTLGEAD
jgi:hypothetical protein